MLNGLPDPNSELSKVVPSSSIEGCTPGTGKTATATWPIHFTNSDPAQKYAISVKKAAENGVATALPRALRYYTKSFPDLQLRLVIS